MIVNACLLSALVIVAPFSAVVLFMGWRLYQRLDAAASALAKLASRDM
jgi:hypothetical protein